jgi:hypothetical protein
MISVTIVTVLHDFILLPIPGTVVPGGAVSFPNLGPLNGGPFFFREIFGGCDARSLTNCEGECHSEFYLLVTVLRNQSDDAMVTDF